MHFDRQMKSAKQGNLLAIAAGAAVLSSFTAPAHAEQRSYVISWLTQASYSQDGDCADGLEPGADGQHTKLLLNDLKYTKEEAAKFLEEFKGGFACSNTGPRCEVNAKFMYRGRVNGAPVTVYENPTSVADPMMHHVTGKYAIGFNLNGKIEDKPFEDPFTHEQGVDNQYFRATGCVPTHRAAPPFHNSQWEYHWGSQRAGMRAWMVSIEGKDLNADGDVTVKIFKALNPVRFDATDEVMRNMTFQIDPDPRSQNTFKGHIKGGVLEVTDGRMQMVGNPYIVPIWDVKNFKMRLTMKPDGTLDGYFGGYQPWLPLYYSYGQGGFPYESQVGTPQIGLYYNLRKFADADPDPKTGHNMSISIAFRLEAVPAIAVTPPPPQTAEAK